MGGVIGGTPGTRVRGPRPKDGAFAALHPVLRRLYLARKIISDSELDASLERLIPPTTLKGIEQAVDLLVEALHAQRRILIVADFDADGATSCALAVRALRWMGAHNVRYAVPNRFEYGYGLTPEIVATVAQQNPHLIITVDNGISSIEGVSEARRRGIDVLITDHHLPGTALPQATAIVNPNQPGDSFASKNLAGVGVIFYVMLALRARLRATDWFARHHIAVPNLARLLDLVALGTVADVVPLDHNNRILVTQGLKRINRGDGCAGIQALLQKGSSTRSGSLRITSQDLGFIVAPRLNAAGRLTDMTLGIECLLADAPQAAADMADKLDRLNLERRAIEKQMQQQALAALQNLNLNVADGTEAGGAGQSGSPTRFARSSFHMSRPGCALPRGLCLFDESWHQGVIGIVAARIKERTHRPVIAFAPSNQHEIKGSARSVPGLHIRDALDAIAARHPRLLSKFGGHAMAAGLSLAREDFAAFSEAFDQEVSRWLSDDDLQGKIFSDGELAAEDFTLSLAETLRHAAPWGQGFPSPVFDGLFDVLSQKVVGEKHLKLVLRPVKHAKTANAPTINAIVFNNVREGHAPTYSRIRAAYKLDVNEYQGHRSLQLIIEHLEQADVESEAMEPVLVL